MLCMLPSSTRKAFKSLDEFTCDNQVAVLLSNLEVTEDLEESIKLVDKRMNNLKIPGIVDFFGA